VGNFVPVEKVAHVVTKVNRASEFSAFNDLYVRTSGAWGAAALLELAGVVETWWDAAIKPLVINAYQLVEVKCTDLTVEAGLSIVLPTSVTGTRAGDPTPGMACAVTRFISSGAGKPRFGRNFLTGMADADCDTDTLTELYRADVQSAQGAFGAAVSGAEIIWDWVIISRFLGFTIAARPNGTRFKKPTPRVTGLIKGNITAITSSRVGVQKRRR